MPTPRPQSIAGLLFRLAQLRLTRRHALGLMAVGTGGLLLNALVGGGGDRREHHRELEALREIDCPTPRCTREAVGTGWMRWSDDHWYDHDRREERVGMWYVECRCPRCGDTFERWTPEWQRMCERLAGER